VLGNAWATLKPLSAATIGDLSYQKIPVLEELSDSVLLHQVVITIGISVGIVIIVTIVIVIVIVHLPILRIR
jgi:hypothetical protein